MLQGAISMTIYYLYVKTHNITGLRYLGQTSKQDPYKYCGSGKDWKAHIKEHGTDISTEILIECKSKQELNQAGRYYSELWNVAKSNEWANRIPETGGGSSPSKQTRDKLRETQLGKKKPPRTATHRRNLSNACKGTSKPRSHNHQLALNESIKNNWTINSQRKEITAKVGKANKGRKHTPETLEKRRQAMLAYWKLRKSLAV